MSNFVIAQTKVWSSFVDSVVTLSSPRACDLNNDGIDDIVIGGGRDGIASLSGVMAFDGVDGTLLWEHSCRDEVFGSSIFYDINGDNIKDVFIVGREAQLLCINGADGSLIWDFFPHGTNPKDSGWYNFYNPQFIHDVNNDGFPDLLVSNGGDHAVPSWDPNRPTGRIMIISSLDGSIIANAQVLDSSETYCSPVVADIKNDGQQWVLYGTGGEHFGGSFWACPLQDLIDNNSLSSSIKILEDAQKGFVAPPSIHLTPQGHYDIYVQAFGGTISKIQGSDFQILWDYYHPNTQSSAALVIGNFTGDFTQDVFGVLYKGQVPSFSDYYQIMLDGSNGEVKFLDSIGAIHFASANAVDLNNDGRDEAVITITHNNNGYFEHQLHAIDFANGVISNLSQMEAGTNVACTPLIKDIDGDNQLEIFYVVKRDSINPMGWKGFYLNRIDLNVEMPNSGIAWGSYMGNHADGIYNFSSINCGTGSLISSATLTHPSCNQEHNGGISLQLQNPSNHHTFVWNIDSLSSQISSIGAGTYQVLVTDNFMCFEFRQFTLNDPHVLSFGGIVAPTCPNDSNGQVTVSSTGCPCMFNTCEFLWDNGIAFANNTSAHEGFNSVTIIHQDGCVVTDSVWIPYADSVSVIQNVNHIVCEGGFTGSIELSDGNQYNIIDYQWNHGDSTYLTDSLTEGIYKVFLTDSRGCIDSLEIEILNLNSESLEWNAYVQNITCFGFSDGEIIIEETGNYPFASVDWFDNTNDTIVSDLSPGNYWVILSDIRGCSDSISFSIDEPSPITLILDATEADGSTSLDGTATVAISGGTPPYETIWNDPNNQENNMAVYLNPGWYSVFVTDSNGCEASDSVLVLNLVVNSIQNENIKVYPNPFSSNIFVSENCINKDYQIKDMQGRIIMKGILKQRSIYFENLSSGVYFIEIFLNEKPELLKIVKE